jgi:hypothetical protein
MTYQRKFTRKTFAFAPFGKRQETPKVTIPTTSELISAVTDKRWREWLTICNSVSENLTIWFLIQYEKGRNLSSAKSSLEFVLRDAIDKDKAK